MTRARNKIILRIITLLITIFSLSFPAYAKYSGGTGEPNNPYQIATADDLMLLGESTEDYGKHFILTADIDLRYFTGTAFNIIGAKNVPFAGFFDGGSHIISNFNHTSTDKNCIGIFGYIEGKDAVIKNLKLANFNIEAENSENVGALAGWIYEGIITNCSVEGGRISGKRYVGGLVGLIGDLYEDYPSQLPSISNCKTQIDVFGKSNVGGLAGYMRLHTSLTFSHASGNVYGDYKSHYVGGLVGGNNYGNIVCCSSSGEITVKDKSQYIGGLLGSYTNGCIENCYSTGNISGGFNCKRIGGLVGHIRIGRITNCYAVGRVSTGRESQYVGGFAGYNESYGTIITCFSTGLVNGGKNTKNIGGLIGYSKRAAGYAMYGSIVSSFWDIKTSGLKTSDGGIGVTTFLMKDHDFYSLNGWGGNQNWNIKSGQDYPHLVWEGKDGQNITEPIIDWFDGKGTQEEPYKIITLQQLILIGKSSLLWDKYFILISDLDLSNVPCPEIGACKGSGFSGSFNGNGHAIYNMYANANDNTIAYHGLFGYISRKGSVTNLSFENAVINGEDNSSTLGILANINYGNIMNCHANGSLTGSAGTSRLGGLVGKNRGTIDSCSADIKIVSGDDSKCIGGLIGQNWGTITSCYAVCIISGGNKNMAIGGLAGANDGNVRSNIINCYANSKITVEQNSRMIGGLTGRNVGGKINFSYATGNISAGEGSTEIGCLTGSHSPTLGGIINKCYFLYGPDNDKTNNGFGEILTEEQMMQKASFVDWDFNNIWMIYKGQSFPHLKWEQEQGRI